PPRETTPSLLTQWSSLPTHPSINPHPFDCSLLPTLCASLSISSFPAIRLYHGSSPTSFTRYRGPRLAAPIAAFLGRMLRPAVSLVTAENTTALFAADDVVFVGHLPREDGRFAALAGRYRDRYTFARAVDDLGGEDGGRVECYNVPDQMQWTLSAKEMGGEAKAMERFVERCGRGLVWELTRRGEGVVYEVGKPLLHYLHHTPSQRPPFLSAIRPLARKYAGHVQFLTTSIPEYGGAEAVAGIFGLDPKRVAGGRTAVVVQDLRTGRVFVYEGETEGGKMDVGGVEGWLVGVWGGDGGRGGRMSCEGG
ncbi:hypothetical protein B0T18DRAFT_473789, partial [Schizothecium vesticola]